MEESEGLEMNRKVMGVGWLRRQIRLGALKVPVWTLGAATLLIAVAAGQAVGPVLAGGVQGSAGVAVEQSIIIDEDSGDTTVTGANEFVITVNDEGTGFTAAIEMQVGDSAVLELDVDNESDDDGNAILELNTASGLDIEVEETGTTIEEAQLSRNTWLLTVDAGGTGDTLDITISPKDNLQEGFYTVTGRLIQVTN